MKNLQPLTDSDFIPLRDTEGVELFEDASSNADWIDLPTDSHSQKNYNLIGDHNRSTKIFYTSEKKPLWQDTELKNCQRYEEFKAANTSECKQSQTNSTEDLQDSSVQTSEDSQKKYQEFEKFCEYARNESIVAVKRSELQLMKATLEKLKLIIDQRSSRCDQEEYQQQISKLQSTIAILNDTIAKKNFEINTLKMHISDSRHLETENNTMKQIIMKMDKRHREMQRFYKPLKGAPVLTDDEKTIVQSIFRRVIKTDDSFSFTNSVDRALPRQFKKFGRCISVDGTDKKLSSFMKRKAYSSQLCNVECTSYMTASCKEEMLFFDVSDRKLKSSHFKEMEKFLIPKKVTRKILF